MLSSILALRIHTLVIWQYTFSTAVLSQGCISMSDSKAMDCYLYFCILFIYPCLGREYFYTGGQYYVFALIWALPIFSCHHVSAHHSNLNLLHSLFSCFFFYFHWLVPHWALVSEDRLATLSVPYHNTSQWGQNRPNRRGTGVFSKWSMLADEMVSLHRNKTHRGPWGVRHIWANRLLMSCLYKPLIMAWERFLHQRIWSGCMRWVCIVWVGTRSWTQAA